MPVKAEAIKLNDLLHLDENELRNTKIRFMVPNKTLNFNPNTDAEDPEKQDMINLRYLVHNRNKSMSFYEGVIAIGFIRLHDDYWLMTGIVRVLNDNGNGRFANAEYMTKKFNFRIVIEFHKNFQNGIVLAYRIMESLNVVEIWNPEKGLNEKAFPGYKNVTVSYNELKSKLKVSEEWRTALKCRKGVYLITDKSNGKLYVGSAYGKDGILGRWETYINSGYDKNEMENGKYPNKKLKELVENVGMDHIKCHFQYSILETFTDDVSDEEIINRESWWKNALQSRLGYNSN